MEIILTLSEFNSIFSFFKGGGGGSMLRVLTDQKLVT